MRKYIFYNQKGMITGIGTCPDADFEKQQLPEGWKILEIKEDININDIDFYVTQGRIKPKPEMGIVINKTKVKTDGADTLTISNIPAGATIMISGATYTIDDGIAELTFQNPGIYQIRISSPPYKDVTLEVEAI